MTCPGSEDQQELFRDAVEIVEHLVMLPVPGVTEVGVVLGHCSDGNHAFTADSHQCGFPSVGST